MTDIGFGGDTGPSSDAAGADTDGAAGGMPSSAAPSGGSMFGGFGSGLFGRKADAYANRPGATPDNPVQDRIDTLASGRARLQRSIDNPLRAMLKPREWQEDVARAGELDQNIMQSKQAIQNQQDMRQTALNAGMDPAKVNAFGATATEKTIVNAWTQDLTEGSFNAVRALGGMGDVGKGIVAQHEGDFMPALAQKNTQAESVIDQLNNAAASGQKAYSATLQQLRDNGTDPSKLFSGYVPGFVVPDKADAWQAKSGGAAGVLAQAKQMVSQYNTKQAGYRLSSDVTDKDTRAAIIAGPTATGSQGPIEGADPRVMPNGEHGSALPLGSRVAEDYVKPTGEGKWSNANPERVKAFNDQLADEQTKGAVNQYKKAKSFHEVANDPKMYTTGPGVALVTDKLMGLARSVSENSAAAGTTGFSKILDTKYGVSGGFLNKASTEFSEVKRFIDAHGKGVSLGEDGQLHGADGGVIATAPRLSATTMAGLKDVANFEYNDAVKNVKERLGQPLFSAGRYGIALNKTGLDGDLQKDPTIQGMANEGRQSYLNDVTAHPAVFEGDTRIMLRDGTTNPDAKKTPLIKDAPAAPPPRVLPSPGHENPPQNGAVLPPTSGAHKDSATVQLAWAKSPDNPYPGIASGVKPPVAGPDGKSPAPIQPNVTPNGAAFLSMVRGSESNGANPNSYNLIVGGKRLTSYDDHPREVGMVTKNGPSTAAGAYQFTKTTWDDVSHRFAPLLDKGSDGKVSFTPQNQDKASWLLAQDRYAKVTGGGNLEADMSDPAKHAGIMKALSGTWTSLPGGSEPNNATGSRLGALGGYVKKFGSAVRSFADKNLTAGIPGNDDQRAAAVQDAIVKTADAAPVVGSTVGQVGGTVVGAAGGPVGAVAGGVAGGAAGGAVGQVVKNYMQGNDISKSVGKEAMLGGAASIIPTGRPLLGAAARVVAGGTAGGVSDALENPDSTLGDNVVAGAKTGAGALVGEAAVGTFGLALGKGFSKAFEAFNRPTQTKLMEAGETIAKGKPEAPQGIGGQPVSATAKAEHADAVKAYDDAVQFAKDHNQDPEHLAHASEQVKAKTPAGEAVANAPAAREKADIGRGYGEIKQDVENAGKNGTPPPLPGKVRYYHGASENADPTSYEAFLTPNEEYARSYRGGPNKVHYVDLTPEQAARQGGYDELNGTAQNFQANSSTSAQLSPLEVTRNLGRPKQAPLSNGPLSIVGNHPDVPKTQFATDRAMQAENNITRPAKDWGDKYQQMFDERSKLLAEERGFLTNGEDNKAKTVRAIADNVRQQQSAAAVYIFGPQKAQAVIAKLQSLDQRYATLMNATHGGDIVANMAKTNADGAAARAAFNKYAADDPVARKMANVLLSDKVNKHAGGSNIPKYAVAAIASAFGIPHMAATVIAMEGPKLLNDWALRRAAGGPVTMAQMIGKRVGQVSAHVQQQARAAGGRVGAEAMQ